MLVRECSYNSVSSTREYSSSTSTAFPASLAAGSEKAVGIGAIVIFVLRVTTLNGFPNSIVSSQSPA